LFSPSVEEKNEMIKLVKEYMENPLTLSVPIKVNVKIGKNWLEMDEV